MLSYWRNCERRKGFGQASPGWAIRNEQSWLRRLFTALGTIFRTGTYIYATTGKAPASMDPALLQAAFRKK